MTWTPNPNPKAPDFEPGNTVAMRHGAYCDRVIAERAAVVHERLLEVAPWVADDHYAPSVHRYITATAREQLAHEALMTADKLSPRLLEAATAAARLAWSMGDALGLTPAGHAKLKMMVAGGKQAEADVADLIARGDAAMAERAAASSGLPAVSPPEPPEDSQ